MRIKMEVCDLCKKNSPDAKIKYKYRAKKHWCFGYEEGWKKIDLCEECLRKMIKARLVNENDSNS